MTALLTIIAALQLSLANPLNDEVKAEQLLRLH